MTIYAIGDIHGCSKSLNNILDKIEFNKNKDELWLVGDLVSRGKKSLDVLRQVINLENNIKVVLGNHDLYLLSVLAEINKPNHHDYFDKIIESPDRRSIIDWLRNLPLVYWNKRLNKVLVHAGIPPQWTIDQSQKKSDFISNQLKSNNWKTFLSKIFGNEPKKWSENLNIDEKNRYIINAFTRMRYCDNKGNINLENKCAPGMQPDNLVPWYDFPSRKTKNIHIIFGHWSSLSLLNKKNISAIDTGCVWGGYLTALPVFPKGNPIKVKCNSNKL